MSKKKKVFILARPFVAFGNACKSIGKEVKRVETPGKVQVLKDTGYTLVAAFITSAIIGCLDLGVSEAVAKILGLF